MIRADGYVKVLDFGLAKLMGREGFAAGDDAATQLVETRDGVVMGTFNYMAPEQARGGDVDGRADLFALGVLLYEMLAGQPPFKGATAADVVGAILFRDPAPLAPDLRGAGRTGADRPGCPAEGARRALPHVRSDGARSAFAGAHAGHRGAVTTPCECRCIRRRR